MWFPPPGSEILHFWRAAEPVVPLVCVCVCVWVCVCMRGGECALVCDWGACESRGGQRQSDVVMERFKGCRDFSALSLPPSPQLAASGMHFSWVSSPQLRSDCWSSLSLSLSLSVYTPPPSPSLCLSPTQKHTLPVTPLSLSLSLSASPPFLAVLTDQVPPPFQVVESKCSALSLPLCIKFSQVISLCAPHSPNDTEDGLEEKLTEISTQNTLFACLCIYIRVSTVCTIYNPRHETSSLWPPVTGTADYTNEAVRWFSLPFPGMRS